MFDRNSAELREQVRAMRECPEFALISEPLDLSGDCYDRYNALSEALGRLPCAERFNYSRCGYGFIYWSARLPSGLVVRASGADEQTRFGRD
jgi:hypothetical protein